MWKKTRICFVCCLLLGCVSTAFSALDDGLMLYWPLDEGQGTVAGDVSNNGFNGTLMEDSKAKGVLPAWDPNGMYGSAVSVEDVFAYIKSDTAIPMNDVDFTVALWMKPKASGGAVFSNWGPAPYDAGSNFCIYAEGTRVRVAHYATPDVIGEVDIPDGVWTHVVVAEKVGAADANGVTDPNLSEVKIYVNGAEVGSGIIPKFYKAENNVYVGARLNGKKNNFNGVIDEVRVYARTLSSEEAFLLYDNRQAGLITKTAAMGGYDFAIIDRLESLGYTVTVIDSGDVKSGAFSVADAEAMDVIVVSEVIGSSDVIPLAAADVPMMNGEGYGWHKMNYAEADGSASWKPVNDPNGNSVVLVNDTHPIAAKANLLAGPIEFLLNEGANATTASVSSLAPGAVSITSIVVDDIEYALIFAIDQGAELAKGAGQAVNRIVGFSLPGNQDPNLSDAGWAMFDTSIRWLNPLPIVLPPMVAYWPMNDGAGTVVADVAGGNNGMLVGLDPNTAWLADGGIRFDNIDGSHIEVPHADAIEFGTESFSISLMLRYTNEPQGTDTWVQKGTSSNTLGTGCRYQLYHTSGTEVRFTVDDNVVKTDLKVPNAAFLTGEWVHVVAIRDIPNDTLSLYADGVLLGSNVDATGDISNGEPLRIGEYVDGAGSAMSGDIKDVRIFDTVLTEDVIAAIGAL